MEFSTRRVSVKWKLINFNSVLNFPSTVGIVFYLYGFFGAIFLFRLSMHWSKVLETFDKAERTFQTRNYADSSGHSLRRRIRLTSTVFLLLALLEHILFLVSFLYDRIMQIKMCKLVDHSSFDFIMTMHLHHVYMVFPLKAATMIWAEYMSLSFAFVWSFIDLFIIIVSIGVASKFQKINRRLECCRKRVSNERS